MLMTSPLQRQIGIILRFDTTQFISFEVLIYNMPKFTSAERILVKSIIASLSIKRIPEQDIIDEVYRQTKKTLTKSGMFYIRKDIKKESYQWYKTMREGAI